MPKGEYDTPGPFRAGPLSRAIFRDGIPVLRPTATNLRTTADTDELTDLLNKGTHFDGMLEALHLVHAVGLAPISTTTRRRNNAFCAVSAAIAAIAAIAKATKGDAE